MYPTNVIKSCLKLRRDEETKHMKQIRYYQENIKQFGIIYEENVKK